jgi:hypothetical protein
VRCELGDALKRGRRTSVAITGSGPTKGKNLFRICPHEPPSMASDQAPADHLMLVRETRPDGRTSRTQGTKRKPDTTVPVVAAIPTRTDTAETHHGWSRCAPLETLAAHHMRRRCAPRRPRKHGGSRCAPQETVVVHRRRSRRDLDDGDLCVENHPAATIPGVSMGFAGYLSGGSSVREWEEEGEHGGGARVPPCRQGRVTRGQN